ncbi:hypothetical protein VTO73DRAFT_12425 [Trametes versicolor]
MPTQDHEPSTSADTIRGLRHLDMSLMSESTNAHDEHEDAYPNHPGTSLYHPPSPFSAFQSEPGSPSGDSVSSFPSVSSSFLFSSGPASHPPSEPDSDLGDSTSGLVIPSLMLPSPSKRPTAYGQTLGELRLLLLGPKGVDLSAIASRLVDDSEDVVEVGIWEEDRPEGGNTRGKRKASLRVSTHWVEHRDAHGLERVEPARNVEILELAPYDPYSEVDDVVQHVLPIIHSPFYQIMNLLNREHPPSGTLAHILSSSSSPLHTALILVACPTPTPAEKALIEALSPHIPIVLLPLASANHDSPPNVSYKITSPHLSSFRPRSIDALRIGLFRTPSTLAMLRAEAASRFLRWREVERAVERVQWGVHASTSQTTATKTPMPPHAQPEEKRGWWDKQEWEAQWEGELSHEVALHLRRRRAGTVRRITPLSTLPPTGQTSYFRARDAPPTTLETPVPRDTSEEGGLLSPPCPSAAFDPLHIPSLVVFSVSLLGALRTRVARSLGLYNGKPAAGAAAPEEITQRRGGRSFGYQFGVGFALMSAFCAGVGIGLLAARF